MNKKNTYYTHSDFMYFYVHWEVECYNNFQNINTSMLDLNALRSYCMGY